jgi:hypothetical protein
MVGKEILTIVVSRVAIKIDKQTTKRMSGKDFSWVRVSMIMARFSGLCFHHISIQAVASSSLELEAGHGPIGMLTLWKMIAKCVQTYIGPRGPIGPILVYG